MIPLIARLNMRILLASTWRAVVDANSECC